MATGNEIKALRERAGLTACEMSELLGSTCSSVYRWEKSGKKEPITEGRPGKLLDLLMDLKPKQLETVSKTFKNGGWIFGLHKLLSFAYKKVS